MSPEAVPAWALILAGGDGVRLRSLTSQIAGGILILFGFLLQWPTLLTLAMFPVLVSMYVRLARAEQHVMLRGVGGEYAKYAARTPAFILGWPLRARRPA